MPGKVVQKLLQEFDKSGKDELILYDQSIQDSSDLNELFQSKNSKKIKKLSLAHNKLSEISPEIHQLSNIEQFNLTNNSIEEWPTSINTLNSLKILKLCFNRLKSIPNEISLLTKLEILDFTGNCLTESSILTGFAELRQLRALYLSDNQFETIPKAVFSIENLQILSLRNNELIEVPYEIENLKNLKELHLQSNHLRVLPPSIAKLDLFGAKSFLNLEDNEWVKEIDDVIQINIIHLSDFLLSTPYLDVYKREIEAIAKDRTQKTDKSKKSNKK